MTGYLEVPTTERGKSARYPTLNTITWKHGSANRCKSCGLRIRSENHEKGSHHNSKPAKK